MTVLAYAEGVRFGRRRFVAGGLGAFALLALLGASREALAAERYTTRGTVRSFGKNRRYVNIAHEDIPGYMLAMTMSFEPADPSQIASLAEGDKVELTFVDDGHRRLIERIGKVG